MSQMRLGIVYWIKNKHVNRMLFVLTGNGKGKTTCAIGMGVRAAGAGKKVLMVQFLKTDASSEQKAIKQIKNFDIKSFGRKGFLRKDYQLAEQGLDFAKRSLTTGKYNFLILDEIHLVLYLKLINQKEVFDFLKKQGEKLDVVLTGRKCPKKIIEMADLVTEFREKKHYYKKGKKARKGIEY